MYHLTGWGGFLFVACVCVNFLSNFHSYAHVFYFKSVFYIVDFAVVCANNSRHSAHPQYCQNLMDANDERFLSQQNCFTLYIKHW